MTKKIVLKTATIKLKKLIWDGKKKVPAGTVFEDEEYFEGKYYPDTADVTVKGITTVLKKKKRKEEEEEKKRKEEEEEKNKNHLAGGNLDDLLKK